ncbi:MAG: cytochrome c3 family protein [Nitrospinae bacterium]|nr:cytochrome c3 family protein [Nitrospinota bacterium]
MRGIWVVVSVLALAAVVGGLFVVRASARPKRPIQPIAFSHKVHAGDYKIACEYCHPYVRRSTVAGVPSVQQCIGCHKITAVDKPEVQKLRGYWDRKEPIPWSKVHDLPDFVIFTHKRHVLKGVECQTCHGPVDTMEQVRQVASLEMGWCVSCHKERQASLECLDCHK